MVTKCYFKTSFLSLFLQLILLSWLALDAFFCLRIGIVLFNENEIAKLDNGSILILILFFCAIPLFVWGEISFAFIGLIRIDENCIRNCGLKAFNLKKNRKIRYAMLKEVKSIVIMPLNENVRGEHNSMVRPVPYLCIKTQKNKSVHFILQFLAPITVKKMLIELSNRCKALGNDIDIDVNQLVHDFKKARFATKE